MPRGSGRLVIDNFLGGLNEVDDPVDLDINEAVALTDFVPYGEGGSIIQREGDSLFFDFGVTGPLVRLFWAADVGKVVVYDKGGNQIIGSNGSSSTTFYSPGTGGAYDKDSVWMVEAPASGGQGPLYFRAEDNTGTTVFRQTSGSAASAAWTASAGSIPDRRWYLYLGNRVWAVRKTNNLVVAPSTFNWSELGDPRNWPAANVAQLAPNDGADFTGVGVVGDLLVIFKYTKAWVVYDLDTGANRALGGPDVGAKDMDTICSTSLGLFFIDPGRGPMVTDGTTAKPLENGRKVNWDRFTRAVYWDDHIYCSGNDDNVLWDYDIRTRSWWKHFAPSGALTVNVDGSVLIAAEETGDRTYRIGFTASQLDYFDGNDILPSWTTPPLLGNVPSEQKRIRRIEVQGASNAEVHFDGDGGLALVKSGSIVPGLQSNGLVVPTPGVARRPALRILKASDPTVRIRLDRIVLDYALRRR